MARIQKKKVSTIPLSRRGKKRYILFRVRVENIEKISRDDLAKTLHQHLLQCFGTLGLPPHRVKLISFNPHSGMGILRCAHSSKEALIAALVLVSSFAGKKAVLRTLQTSGTIKSLRPRLDSGT
ncbi:MAG: Rpp14/Pop5 family protein [Candidatus Diapherotrites archaeon]|nr:Rpp14/Pop5 family protein [Candidatus Diapherotrites archaeon]MDZ4256222.1 Rpp14/Pop5 family protein [archaeon]